MRIDTIYWHMNATQGGATFHPGVKFAPGSKFAPGCKLCTWTRLEKKKQVLIVICKCRGAKVKKWPWPSIPSLAQLVVCIYQHSGHRLQWFLKNPLFSIFPIEKPMLPNLTLPLNSQGQPRVIIWTNYDGLESQMLRTKFRGNRSTGSGEEDFWRVFTIYGRLPSWSYDQHHVHGYSFPCTWKHTYKIWLKMAQ